MDNRKNKVVEIEGGRAKAFATNIEFIIKNTRLMTRVEVSKEIKREFEEQLRQIDEIERKHGKEITRAKNFNIRKGSGLLIYDIVRRKKPKIVLETGIGNGFSTRLILAALNKNGKGELYSTEINKDVGKLLDGIDTSRWRFRVGSPDTVLTKTLKEVKSVDIFLHDSSHAYKNMTFEFDAVKNKMAKNSIVMSDDINVNAAFMEFANKLGKVPKVVPDIRRCFGFFKI